MGLHVGGIHIQANKKEINQQSIVDFIREYWLKLGAKESRKNPLEFEPLNLEKTGFLGFAIGPAEKDAEGNLFIGIHDSERYRADPALARALAHHFNNEVWFYTITDSVNQAYVKKYGKEEEIVKKYDDALEKIAYFPYSFLYFDKLKEELPEKELKKFKFLALESIPHRPSAEYSGPGKEQLNSNNLVIKAKKYAKERNAEELLKIADNHDVYYDVIEDVLESADPSNPQELVFLSKMANWTIKTKNVCLPIIEAALRLEDEKMFEKALEAMKYYKLYELERRAIEIGNKGEDYLAFRLIEGQLFKKNYQEPRILNNAIHFLSKTTDKIGISQERLATLLEMAYNAGHINPAIYHNMACFFVKFKDYEKVILCILQAVKYGYPLETIKNDPDLDPVKKDPRLKEILKQKPGLTSIEHLSVFREGEPWIVPSIGLHLYFENETARIGAAEILEELFKEFPEMFNYYLKSGHIQLSSTLKGKVARDITLLKKGGSKYGYSLYYNAIERGRASDLRFLLYLSEGRDGEITLQLPLYLLNDIEKLYKRLLNYAQRLPFKWGNAGYSFCPYYENNGSEAEEDVDRLLGLYYGFTTSRKTLDFNVKTESVTPNWLTFVGPKMAKKLDLKDIPSNRIQTLKNKSIVIRAAEKPFIGLCSNLSDLDLLPKVAKVFKLFLPKMRDDETYLKIEAERFEKIMNLK